MSWKTITIHTTTISEVIERMVNLIDNNLKHFGVKGMRWGKRNSKHTAPTISKRRQSLQTKYENKGLSKKEAESAADRRIKAEKIAAVTVGVAVIATGSYFAHKYYSMNADALIKKGYPFQHMGKDGEDLTKLFYASHLKRDNKAYAKNDLFGAHWTTQKTLVSNKDIKIAGKKVSLDTFSTWVKESPVAQEKFGKKFEGYDNLTKSQQKTLTRRVYNGMNTNLRTPDMNDKRIYQEFYDRLADKGYSAIRDINDQQSSGMRSPIILFDNLSDIMTTKVKDLS